MCLPILECDRCGGGVVATPQHARLVCHWCIVLADARRAGNTKRTHLRRQFNGEEIAMIRAAHAGVIEIRALVAQLGTSNTAVYRVMTELGLQRRRDDHRRRAKA